MKSIAQITRRLARLRFLSGAALVLGLVLGPAGCSTRRSGSASPAPAAPARYARLELNDGKKWVVDKPMMAHLRNLEQAVVEFDRTPGKNHALLASEIQEHLGRLVTHCTMEGKAHDELHKWLMPFLGLSADYSKAAELQVQRQKLQEIRHALRVFNEYFE